MKRLHTPDLKSGDIIQYMGGTFQLGELQNVDTTQTFPEFQFETKVLEMGKTMRSFGYREEFTVRGNMNHVWNVIRTN